jgi:hypothetical protein
MNPQMLIELGQSVLSAGTAKDGIKTLIAALPASTLATYGLSRGAAFLAAPVAVAFVAGAATGAGAMLFFAPGGEQMRGALNDKLEELRKRLATQVAKRDIEVEMAPGMGGDEAEGRAVSRNGSRKHRSAHA